MQTLKNKMKKQSGFTLVEMLIVVAIIAILVAVSIPLVSSSMEKTKHATDAANERAAKAEIMVQYLAGDQAVIDGAVPTVEDDKGIKVSKTGSEVWYYYNAKTGGIVSKDKMSTITPYGQCRGGKDANTHVGSVLALKIDENGKIDVQWEQTAGTKKGDLCSDYTDPTHPTTP